MADRSHALVKPGMAGEAALTPLYSAARALLGRDGGDRSLLAEHIAPRPHDLIVDFFCGAGELALQLAKLQPAARILAVDSDPTLVARAQARGAALSDAVNFACAAPDDIPRLLRSVCATKVVVTLTDTHSPVEKSRLLELARSIIDPLGALFVIDHGAQRTALMRGLFNADRARRSAPSVVDRELASPLIRLAGFVAVDEALSWATTTGSVSLFRARAS